MPSTQQDLLHRYQEQVRILGEIAHLLNSNLDPESVLRTILGQLGRLVQYDGVSFIYQTEQGLELVAYKHSTMPSWQFQSEIVPASTLELEMLTHKRPVLVANTAEDGRWSQRPNIQPIGSWVGSPMLVQDEVVGFINLSKAEAGFYDESDQQLLFTFASQAATAVHNARTVAKLHQELQERQRVEQALFESEHRFRTLFETMTQGVIFRTREMISAINPAAVELTGLTLDELRAEYNGTGIVWPAMREDGTIIPLAEYPTTIAMNTGQAVRDTLMCYYNPVRQEYRWMLVDAVPQFRPPETTPYEVYAILKDVTDSKKFERALRESETRFRALFETVSHGVIYYDRQGRVTAYNPATSAILGPHLAHLKSNPDIMLGNEEFEIVGEDGRPLKGTLRPAKYVFETGERLSNIIIGLQKRSTQQIQWLQIEAVPLFHADDPMPYQVYIVLQDITEQKVREEALRQTQKLESLGVLAGGIAHDFNNLLVALLGQSSLALRKIDEEHPAHRHIGKVVQAAEHAAALTRQMLAFSGRGHFEVLPLNLNKLVEENVPLFHVAIPKHVRLDTYLLPNLPLIEADASQIQQVVMNLVLNAAEAVDKEQGVVTVVTGTQLVEPLNAAYWQIPDKPLQMGNYVRLEVHDNGSGITAEQRAKIFDPFFTTKLTGRGLGLAAVLGIMRGHKGGLRVYSEPGGTTFVVLFPINPTAEPPEPPPLIPPTITQDDYQGRTVLVIDDEPDVREALRDMLESYGLTVLDAADGRAGLEVYRQHHATIALILLDLSMPGLTGAQTLAYLRTINPQVRVLLSSGYNQGEALAGIPPQHIMGFVPKPYHSDRLLESIGRALSII